MSTSIISIHPDNENNVDIICNDILSEYELSPSNQQILSSKLKAHIVSMIKAQKNLSNEAKENIQRLYHNDLIHKQKQKIQNEQLKIYNEKKEATFSPKINTYSKNLCSNGRSRNNHYSKNQKYKTQIQLQRIINKANEVDVCNKANKQSITNENNNKYIHCKSLSPSSLKFIDRHLQTQNVNELFIPNLNYIISRDLNIHLNETINTSKKNGNDYTGNTSSKHHQAKKDSYAEIFKTQIFTVNNNLSYTNTNNITSSLSFTQKAKKISSKNRLPISPSSPQNVNNNINASKNMSNDDLFEIKESDIIESQDFTMKLKDDAIIKEQNNFIKGESNKTKQQHPKTTTMFKNSSIQNAVSKTIPTNNKEKGCFNSSPSIIVHKYPFQPVINQKNKGIVSHNKSRINNCVERLHKPQSMSFENLPSNKNNKDIKYHRTYGEIKKTYNKKETISKSKKCVSLKKKNTPNRKSFQGLTIREIRNKKELMILYKEEKDKKQFMNEQSKSICIEHLNNYRSNILKNLYEKINEHNDNNTKEIIKKIKNNNIVLEEGTKQICIKILENICDKKLKLTFNNFIFVGNDIFMNNNEN